MEDTTNPDAFRKKSTGSEMENTRAESVTTDSRSHQQVQNMTDNGAEDYDGSRRGTGKGDNFHDISELPSYAELQEGGLQGASAYLEDDGEADDNDSPGKYSALLGSRPDEDNDSNTELFTPKHLMTPTAYRKEYICGVFLKYSIFIFNFLFWVVAVAAGGFGYWILSQKGQLFTGGVYVFLDPAVMLCMVGCTIFIVAFFGFLGALRENILLLKIFRVCLILVLLIQTGIGIVLFVFYTIPEARKTLLSGPEKVLMEAIKSYYDDDDKQKWIDLIQKEFKCCGISHNREGYLDWQINMYFNCSASNPSIKRCAVPVSCCIFEPGDYINVMCGFQTTNREVEDVFDRIYTKGCMQGLADWMRLHESYIGGFLLGFIAPQILGVIFSTLFIRHVNRNRARWRLLQGEPEEET